MEAYNFITDHFDGVVKSFDSIIGVILLLIGANKFWKAPTLDQKDWPIIGFLAVGAFLLVGSQYKSFKVSATGLEALRNDVAEAASAAAEVASETEHTASAVAETQAQLNTLTSALEKRSVLPPTITSPIRGRLQSSQPIDIAKLQTAQRVFARIQRRQ